MLGLQGYASSKEYRCVACSSTFTGLASLLVHQATHASTLSRLPTQKQPDSVVLETSAPATSSENNRSLLHSPSAFYICDCGEEFKDFSAMIEHKESHVSESQSSQPLDNNDLTSVKEDGDLSRTQCESLTAAEEDEYLGGNSTTERPAKELCPSTNTAANVNQEDSAAADSSTQVQSPQSTEDNRERLEKTLAAEEMSEDNEAVESGPKNKSLMMILASAYGKCLMSSQSPNNNESMVTLKEETVPVPIAPQTTKDPSSVTDMSVKQSRRVLKKPGMKTKAPSISRLLESSTKEIVSLTKIFSPVVLLETRQKFIDLNSTDTYGNYQCARCRKVFQNVDGLTEHHFLHKKERIKCCRCCKQLIIGRIPLPDNHVCPQLRRKPTVSQLSFKSNAPEGQKTMQITEGINNKKRVFFCPVCKHNFTGRYDLKMHKCRGPVSNNSPQTKPLNSAAGAHLNVQDEGNISQSIGVGTQVRRIKAEENSDSDGSDGQWTIPLDDEMEDSSVKDIGKTGTVNHSETKCGTLHYFVKDGVRRYPCNNCQKIYSSLCNLSRHKKLCCFKPKSLQRTQSSNTISLNANNRNMSACYICGRTFTRRDNMMVHRKKCELRRTMNPQVPRENNQSLPSNSSPSLTEEDDGGSWSIMSLPSVLPRRVTCECGAGFTSPKLLLEHLQKHAQESYTCPTCGETVSSWADYEIHLQFHMHPHHQKRSQPLLLRFKQPTDIQQQPFQPEPHVREKQPFFQEQHPKQRKRQIVECTKCGSTFASRCSLRRHLTWSQCRGRGTNNPHMYKMSLQHKLPK